MQSIKQIQRLNERELDAAVSSSASWHTDYRDTAYIYIGGLGTDLSEGDVIAIFSQYGDPVWIRLMRDKETGKSKGFAWLKYEDQPSCDLAVDNLSGASVMGRLLAVDHTRYKKRDNEDETEGYVGQDRLDAKVELRAAISGRRGGDRVKSDGENERRERTRPLIKEEIELQRLIQDHDNDDPMKEYMIKSKQEEVDEALKAAQLVKSSYRDKDLRHHRSSRRRRSQSPDERSRRRSTSRDSRDRRSHWRHRDHGDRHG